MFAVLKTGGKQYKVSQNDVIIVEKLSAQAGDVVQFDKIMMIGDDKVDVGVPIIEGAAVHAEVLEQAKGNKVTSFVKRRRKHSSKRTRGHRQKVTVLRVEKIISSGAKSTGERIEVGVSVIGVNTKAGSANIQSTKSEVIKKSAAKAGSTKKAATKAAESKKQVTKPEATKKPITKENSTKKLAKKVETVKKSAPKAKPTKKSSVTKKTG